MRKVIFIFKLANSNNREENEEEMGIKVGSLQLFANHFDIVGNYGYMMFSKINCGHSC